MRARLPRFARLVSRPFLNLYPSSFFVRYFDQPIDNRPIALFPGLRHASSGSRETRGFLGLTAFLWAVPFYVPLTRIPSVECLRVISQAASSRPLSSTNTRKTPTTRIRPIFGVFVSLLRRDNLVKVIGNQPDFIPDGIITSKASLTPSDSVRHYPIF